jgi:hypothetical protein
MVAVICCIAEVVAWLLLPCGAHSPQCQCQDNISDSQNTNAKLQNTKTHNLEQNTDTPQFKITQQMRIGLYMYT